MKTAKFTAIALAIIVSLAMLIGATLFWIAPRLSLFESLKEDPYASTLREATITFELLGRDYASSGMTFGTMIAQAGVHKRSLDSLLVKLSAPSTDKERANEKLVREFIISAAGVAYSLEKYLRSYMQMELAQKNISRASDTSVCGLNWGSLAMTSCLLRVQAAQQEAFAEAENTKRQTAAAQSDKSTSIRRLQAARDNLAKAGYVFDEKISNAVNQLGRNI